MKTKIPLCSVILIFTIMFFTLSLSCQENNYGYSVKKRWAIKASVARYKTVAYDNDLFANMGDFVVGFQNRKMFNFKIGAHYGVTKFIEIGLFSGFQHYEYYSFDFNLMRSFAPLFGASANFHILPFLVKSNKCKWDLYLTAQYGGCYLPYKELVDADNLLSNYRHEYGLGLGVSYYFKNIIGIFAEGYVGQFFFFKSMKLFIFEENYTYSPDVGDGNFSFRIGIAAKFYKRK